MAVVGDREQRVRLAASLIGAKIRGQVHVLTRIARCDETVHVADTTAHMHAWRRSLAGARTLDEVMGEAEAGGVWLGGNGKKILVDAYEAACQRSVTGALPGYSGSWRRHIAHSAQMLARAIVEPDYPWSGVAWR